MGNDSNAGLRDWLNIAMVNQLRTELITQIPRLSRLADAPLPHGMGQRLYLRDLAGAGLSVL
jgi:hypothetical protein